jgi:hypothetical protein
VWVLARLPEWVEVGGDATGTYVYVANAHDGSMAVTAAVTPVRIVCANTLGYALGRAEGVDAQRTFRFRHTGGLHSRLHEARRVMQIPIDYAAQFKRLGDRLALAPISERALRGRVLERLFAAPDGTGERAARNRAEAKAAVMAIFLGQGLAGHARRRARHEVVRSQRGRRVRRLRPQIHQAQQPGAAQLRGHPAQAARTRAGARRLIEPRRIGDQRPPAPPAPPARPQRS